MIHFLFVLEHSASWTWICSMPRETLAIVSLLVPIADWNAETRNQRSWQVDRQLDNFDNCSWKRQVSQNLCKGAFGLDMIHFLFVLEHSASWTWICSMPRETLARVSLLVPIADWNAETRNQRSWQVDRQLDNFDNCRWKRQVSQNLCKGAFGLDMIHFLFVLEHSASWTWICSMPRESLARVSLLVPIADWNAEAHNQRSWQVDRQLDNFDNCSWKGQVSQNLCKGAFGLDMIHFLFVLEHSVSWTWICSMPRETLAIVSLLVPIADWNAETRNQRSWQVDRQLDNFDNCRWKRQVSQNLCKGAFGLDMIHFLFVLEHSASWTWICSMPRETLAIVSLLVPIADWNAETRNQRSWQVDRQLDNFDNCRWKRQVSQNLCKGAFGLDMIHFLFVLEHSASWTWICSMPRETLAIVSLLVPIADWNAETRNQRSWQVDRQLDNFDNCRWKRQVSQNLCKGAFGLDMIHFLFVLEHSASWTWICSMPRETLAIVSLLVPIADWNAETRNQRSWQVDRQLDNFDNCRWKRQVSQNLCKGAFGLDMIHFLFVLEHSASWTWICSMPRETLAIVSLLVPIADWNAETRNQRSWQVDRQLDNFDNCRWKRQVSQNLCKGAFGLDMIHFLFVLEHSASWTWICSMPRETLAIVSLLVPIADWNAETRNQRSWQVDRQLDNFDTCSWKRQVVPASFVPEFELGIHNVFLLLPAKYPLYF